MCTLEGHHINGNSDLPGSTMFYDIQLNDINGYPVIFNWNTWINPNAQTFLQGLDVDASSQSQVTLYTDRIFTTSKIGVFRPSTHMFYLDLNGNGIWEGAEIDGEYDFGIVGEIPVTGDWNGDGRTEIGVFRAARDWYLDSSGNGVWGPGDVAYGFGIAGDKPVTGDWNGDGRTEIGVFRGARDWYLDSSGNGVWGAGDVAYGFGIAGDKPVTGDWNGDGRTEIGVFRGARDWYLDSSGNGVWGAGDVAYGFGIAGDKPVTGDWNGDEKNRDRGLPGSSGLVS